MVYGGLLKANLYNQGGGVEAGGGERGRCQRGHYITSVDIDLRPDIRLLCLQKGTMGPWI